MCLRDSLCPLVLHASCLLSVLFSSRWDAVSLLNLQPAAMRRALHVGGCHYEHVYNLTICHIGSILVFRISLTWQGPSICLNPFNLFEKQSSLPSASKKPMCGLCNACCIPLEGATVQPMSCPASELCCQAQRLICCCPNPC